MKSNFNVKVGDIYGDMKVEGENENYSNYFGEPVYVCSCVNCGDLRLVSENYLVNGVFYKCDCINGRSPLDKTKFEAYGFEFNTIEEKEDFLRKYVYNKENMNNEEHF